jgi:hypothetical protein
MLQNTLKSLVFGGMRRMDWIDLALDTDRWRAVVTTIMNIRVPQNVGNFLTGLVTVSFSGRTVLHGVRKLVSWLVG